MPKRTDWNGLGTLVWEDADNWSNGVPADGDEVHCEDGSTGIPLAGPIAALSPAQFFLAIPNTANDGYANIAIQSGGSFRLDGSNGATFSGTVTSLLSLGLQNNATFSGPVIVTGTLNVLSGSTLQITVTAASGCITTIDASSFYSFTASSGVTIQNSSTDGDSASSLGDGLIVDGCQINSAYGDNATFRDGATSGNGGGNGATFDNSQNGGTIGTGATFVNGATNDGSFGAAGSRFDTGATMANGSATGGGTVAFDGNSNITGGDLSGATKIVWNSTGTFDSSANNLTLPAAIDALANLAINAFGSIITAGTAVTIKATGVTVDFQNLGGWAGIGGDLTVDSDIPASGSADLTYGNFASNSVSLTYGNFQAI